MKIAITGHTSGIGKAITKAGPIIRLYMGNAKASPAYFNVILQISTMSVALIIRIRTADYRRRQGKQTQNS